MFSGFDHTYDLMHLILLVFVINLVFNLEFFCIVT